MIPYKIEWVVNLKKLNKQHTLFRAPWVFGIHKIEKKNYFISIQPNVKKIPNKHTFNLFEL
jgi:hypothetical protein